MNEGKSNVRFYLLLAAVVLVGWYLYERKQVQSGQLAATKVSNPIARVAGWFAGTSQGVAAKAGPVGSAAGRVFSAPVTNITSGNKKKTAYSILTGGISDVFNWG